MCCGLQDGCYLSSRGVVEQLTERFQLFLHILVSLQSTKMHWLFAQENWAEPETSRVGLGFCLEGPGVSGIASRACLGQLLGAGLRVVGGVVKIFNDLGF